MRYYGDIVEVRPMLKIPSKVSIWLSIVLSVLFFVLLVASCFYLPLLIYMYMDLKGATVMNNTPEITAIAYAMVAVMMIADVLLFILLQRVRKSLVFTDISVALIRGISWCAVVLGALCFALGFYFLIAFAIAFGCIFLGICLRVTKNVIEEATAIKAENDFTI